MAEANLARAGVSDRVKVRIGRAVDSLAALSEAGEDPFDLVFIDADKASNPEYLEWALRLSRPGTVIIGDNVVREGAVIDDANTDPNVVGVRTFAELLGREPRVRATVVQTVGVKGYDGFALGLVAAG
jgi:predicted O-methyltransferase YrrM